MKKTEFIAGIAVGFVVGSTVIALTSPKSGRELRDEIKKESQKTYSCTKSKLLKLRREFDYKVSEVELKLFELKDASYDKAQILKDEIVDLIAQLDEMIENFSENVKEKLIIKTEKLKEELVSELED